MKTILKNKVLVLLSAFIMLFCGVISTSLFKKDNSIQATADKHTSTPTLTIESNNVSYADSIYILYAVSNDGFDRAQNEIKMLFWEEVQEDYVVGTELYSTTDEGSKKVKGKDCLIFYSEGLAAKEMTTDIYSRAYVEIDGVAYYSDVMKFSILEYVYTMKENGGLTTNQQNLFNNMLNYGASAQYQFNHNVDRIANGDYYSITIINGKLPDGFAHGRYKNKEKIKVKAEKAPEGMKFSHWVDEKGIIVSYDEHIEIELKGNKTYQAVYKDISSVATQLVLTSEIPYDGDTNDIELPTAVSIDVGGETVTLEVTWNTESFKTNTVGTQTLYATLVDQTAYDKYDIEVGGIMMNVTTLPYTYEIDTDTGLYILTGYYGTDTEITLPTSYKNTFVTTIASKAFNKALTLTNVVIPNTYTKIEQTAFFLCDNIESITIPFVGETLPDQWGNVTNSWFGWIFGATEYETQYTLLPLALKTVNLTEGATSVPDYAFYNCSQIENFNLPSTIRGLGHYAFAYCAGIKEFTVPENLVSFSNSFRECYNLKRVHVTNLDQLYQIEIGGGNAGGGSSVFGEGADLYCNGKLVTEITIPNYVSRLAYLFQSCTSIKKIVIPNTVKKIYWAFPAMTNLETVVFEEGCPITDLSYGFFDCVNLRSVNLEALTELTTLNDTFYGCQSLEKVTLPDSVTSIGNEAFRSCNSLTSVTIPDGVTSIGNYTFYNCSSLTSVTIPDGVTSIGDRAFYNCSSLTNITIPELVYDIGSEAFSNCNNLAKVTILSQRLTEIESYAFSACKALWEIYNLSNLEFTIGSDDFGGIAKYAKVIHTSLDETAHTAVDKDGFITYTDGEEIVLYGYMGSGGNVEIPEGVTAIYEQAFYANQAITSVVIPDSVSSIGEYAFYSCDSLTSVVIGNSVSSIGEYAFYSCDSLTSVVIPDSVSSIGNNAFGSCYKLVEVINHSQNLTITKGASSNGYVGCYALAVYNSNDTFTETKLSNDNGYVVYTDGEEKILVGYIGTETDLVLPSYITKINQYAFYCCDSLTSVVIGNGVTSIGGYAFYDCDSLTSVVIGNSVTSISSYAFADCYSLTSVVIGNGVTSIGYQAFYNCDNLTSVVIPDSVTSIGDYAFSSCGSLTSVVIPDSVTSIGYYAFYNCDSLTSVVIGNGVTSIGYYAFDNCDSLTSVIFKDTSTWYQTQSYSYWINKTGGTQTSVTDSSTNATYFKDTYYNYYWYKL